MTERDVTAVARALALLVEDARATMTRLSEQGWLTQPGQAVVLAWMERAAKALEDAEALL